MRNRLTPLLQRTVDLNSLIEEYEEFVAGRVFTDTERDSQLLGAIGLVGEAGEVSELVKKAILHKKGMDRGKLVLEMGDVLWYFVLLCKLYKISIIEIILSNIEKLEARDNAHYGVDKDGKPLPDDVVEMLDNVLTSTTLTETPKLDALQKVVDTFAVDEEAAAALAKKIKEGSSPELKVLDDPEELDKAIAEIMAKKQEKHRAVFVGVDPARGEDRTAIATVKDGGIVDVTIVDDLDRAADATFENEAKTPREQLIDGLRERLQDAFGPEVKVRVEGEIPAMTAEVEGRPVDEVQIGPIAEGGAEFVIKRGPVDEED